MVSPGLAPKRLDVVREGVGLINPTRQRGNQFLGSVPRLRVGL